MSLPFLRRGEKPAKEKTEESAAKLGRGISSIKDIIAPPAIEVDFNHLKIGNLYFRTLFVAGYPRFVSANWLEPLINFEHSLDISMFVYPIEGKGILQDLRRKIAEMEAEIETDIQRGRIPNVETKVALEDARKLQEQLAKGAERFFQFALYVTVSSDNLEELEKITQKVESTLASLMIIAKPTTLQMEDGFKSTLPICDDRLMITRNMDTTSLATTFPFTSSELSANEGVLYGINQQNGSLILFDRFSMENANEILFGKAGSGKSIIGHENVLYKDRSGRVKQTQIGPLIEKLIEDYGSEKIDQDLEGVVNPGLKVFTFDKNLKGRWAKVTVAARKPISKGSLLYKITTQSGREITVTPDHNLIILKDGKIRAMRGQAVKVGQSVPLPRFTPEPKNPPQDIDLSSLDVNGRTEKKQVPPILFSLSNKQVAAYLSAYFEGDGTVGSNGEVTATSKSKELISDLAYLLLRFGIVGRIRKKFKRATNSDHQGDTYYQIVISGQKDLRRFAEKIGFLTPEKKEKLKEFLGREHNTNVDVIPSLEPIFKDIYQTLYSSTEIKSPAYFSDVKRGKWKPSRKSLRGLIQSIETNLAEIRTTSPNENMFWLAKTVSGEILEVPATGREAIELLKIEKHLERLKTLANSDLFWDPIVKIEKIKNQDDYVYDLTVDNEVFLAGFGGLFVHNSYCIKAEVLRQRMFGTEIIILDPENEYQALCEAAAGQYIDFSFQSPSRINPFDLSQIREEENPLGQKILSLHALLKILLGEMSADEEAILDRALVLTYKQKGITTDPETHGKEPPLMEDLYKTLFGMEEPEAKTLSNRVEKYVKGSLGQIFNQKTNVEFTNPFTVFGLKNLESELRPAAMFVVLEFIWNRVKSKLKKRILVVDEAWYLMKHADSAFFLYSIAKRARKYYLGLTTITQDVQDFLTSEHGQAIIQNSSIQILMKQSPAAIDQIAEVFYLSEGEKQVLLAAPVGEGLFFAGQTHVAIKVVASEEEHQLITTKPAELLEMKKKTIEERKKEAAQKEEGGKEKREGKEEKKEEPAAVKPA